MTERTRPKAAPRDRAGADRWPAVVAGVAVGLAGGIRDRHVPRQSAATPPCRAGASRRPGGWRRSRAAKSRPCVPATGRCALPDLAFRDGSGSERQPRRLARAHRAAQPVGDLVRPMPQGDAGARRAAGQARRPGFEVVADQYRHPRPRQAADLAQGGRHRQARLLRRSQRKVFQDLKIVGRAIGMPTTMLVDRPAARSAPSRARPNGRARTHSSWSGGAGEIRMVPRCLTDAGVDKLASYADPAQKSFGI